MTQNDTKNKIIGLGVRPVYVYIYIYSLVKIILSRLVGALWLPAGKIPGDWFMMAILAPQQQSGLK